jgi:hypothetical protein
VWVAAPDELFEFPFPPGSAAEKRDTPFATGAAVVVEKDGAASVIQLMINPRLLKPELTLAKALNELYKRVAGRGCADSHLRVSGPTELALANGWFNSAAAEICGERTTVFSLLETPSGEWYYFALPLPLAEAVPILEGGRPLKGGPARVAWDRGDDGRLELPRPPGFGLAQAAGAPVWQRYKGSYVRLPAASPEGSTDVGKAARQAADAAIHAGELGSCRAGPPRAVALENGWPAASLELECLDTAASVLAFRPPGEGVAYVLSRDADPGYAIIAVGRARVLPPAPPPAAGRGARIVLASLALAAAAAGARWAVRRRTAAA